MSMIKKMHANPKRRCAKFSLLNILTIILASHLAYRNKYSEANLLYERLKTTDKAR